MNSFPTELIYVLVFGVIVLLQYLMKRIGPQQQQESEQDEPDPEFPQQEQANSEIPPVSTAPDTRFGRSAPPVDSPALPQRRFSRQSLMGNRRAVQNAIVIATILGPCRAHEPHDVR